MALNYTTDAGASSVYRANFYRRALSRIFCKHEPRFTHTDFQRKNVLIQRLAQSDPNHRQFQMTLIDWATAGWYPSYWEYSLSMISSRWHDGWDGWVAKVLQPFDAEFPWLQMLYLDLWS